MGCLFVITVMFFYCYHPFHMLLGVVSYSLISSYYFFSFYGSPWFSYVFVLMFVGGLMIVFVYMTSLLPNEWVGVNLKSLSFFSVIILMVSYLEGMVKSKEVKLSGFYGMGYYLVIFLSFLLLVCFLFITSVAFDPNYFMKSYF